MPMNDDGKLDLSRRKLLGSVATIGAAGALGGAGSMAFFSDREEFANNQLVAGELDLKVAASHHYVDWLPDTDTSGVSLPVDPLPAPQETDDAAMPGDGQQPDIQLNPGSAGGGDTVASPIELVLVDDDEENGDAEDAPSDEPALEFALGSKVNDINGGVPPGSYTNDAGEPASLCDIDAGGDDDVDRPIIDLDDVKPGDFGFLRFAFASCDNPAFISVSADVTDSSENGVTEPEADDPDEQAGVVELLDEVQLAFVEGDVYDTLAGGSQLIASPQATLRDLDGGLHLVANGDIPAEEGGGTGDRNCFSGETNHRYTLVWWLPVDHANEIQTDTAEFSVGLYAEQCRHNDGSMGNDMGNDGAGGGGGPGNGDDNGDEPEPDVVVDGDQAISWVAACCESDPGPLEDHITCVTLDEDDEVDAVGLTGVEECDVYYKTGGGSGAIFNGRTDEPAPSGVTNSNYCGGDQTNGRKIEGGNIVDLKDEENLPGCQDT